MLVTYDSKKVTYLKLLDIFWKNIDPYDNKGQFCDKGPSYLAAIFYTADDEKKLIKESINKLMNIDSKIIVTKFIKLDTFYLAEDYHQNYYKRNPIRYKYYKTSCGRDQRLKEIWK